MTSSSEDEECARELCATAKPGPWLLADRAEAELERCEGDLAVAVREARQARDEATRLRRVVQAVESLADDYRANCDPKSIQAQVAEFFRAALAEGSAEQPTCEHGKTTRHALYRNNADGSLNYCPGPNDDERPAKDSER